MVCEYRYYEEDDPKEELYSRYRVRMKIYDCNPCKLKRYPKYYCRDRRSTGSAAAPVLSATPVLPALSAPPGLPVPGTTWLSAPPAVPVVINDYWADDYYRRIRTR